MGAVKLGGLAPLSKIFKNDAMVIKLGRVIVFHKIYRKEIVLDFALMSTLFLLLDQQNQRNLVLTGYA